MTFDTHAGKYDDLTKRTFARLTSAGRSVVGSTEFQNGCHGPSPRIASRIQRDDEAQTALRRN